MLQLELGLTQTTSNNLNGFTPKHNELLYCLPAHYLVTDNPLGICTVCSSVCAHNKSRQVRTLCGCPRKFKMAKKPNKLKKNG